MKALRRGITSIIYVKWVFGEVLVGFIITIIIFKA